MNSIKHFGEHADDDFSDNLPLLTEVVEEDTLDDLPTLTEIVAAPLPVISQESWATDVVMADGDMLDLPESVGIEIPSREDETENFLPPPETGISAPRTFDDEEMQHLLHQLEAHIDTVLREKLSLDTVFTKTLTLQLEQLQQMAITQAIDELKAELPEILRDALNARSGL